MSHPHILLADDDAGFCRLLSDYLALQGFKVSAVHDGEAAGRAIRERAFDAMVLDVMMPRADGFKVLEEVRKISAVPILMLTARGEDIDRIVGLEMGADDYLAKPCNPREVAARLRAVLRRGPRDSSSVAEITSGDISLAPAARRVRIAGQSVDVTGAEFEILRVLIEDAGQVVSKDGLAKRALGRSLGLYDRSVDMHVSRLRGKLGEAADGGPRIKTVRNRGYVLVVQ